MCERAGLEACAIAVNDSAREESAAGAIPATFSPRGTQCVRDGNTYLAGATTVAC